jgi:hypothetical protein
VNQNHYLHHLSISLLEKLNHIIPLFKTIFFLEQSSYSSPEKKPLFFEDQELIPVQLNCYTQGTISLSTSPIFLNPKAQTQNIENMIVNRMDAIVAAKYPPLILPQVVYSFPPNDYMKYLAIFNGEGGVTTEEHLNSFYIFANNFNVEHVDV